MVINLHRTIALFVFFLSFSAQAFLIEPYVAYESMKGEQTVSGLTGAFSSLNVTTVDDETTAGYDIGARLGFDIALFSAGVDAFLTTGEDDETFKDPINNVGVFVGFDFPILVRVYAVYLASVTTKITNDDGSKTDVDASGYKVGVGFTGLPLVSINLEMIRREWDRVTFTDLIPGQTMNIDSSTNSVGLSVSFPISL